MAQLIFGRFFWLWMAGFISLGSYFLAESANYLIQLSLGKFYSEIDDEREFHMEVSPDNLGGSGLKRAASKIFDNCNLFGDKCNPPEEKKKKVVKKVEKKENKVEEKSKLQNRDQFGCPPLKGGEDIPRLKKTRIRLRGTIYVKSSPDSSLVALYVKIRERIPPKNDQEAKAPPKYRYVWRVELFSRGDEVMGVKVCYIGPKEVYFLKGDKLYKLSLEKQKKGPLDQFFLGAFGLSREEKKEEPKGPVEKKVVSRAMLQDWLLNPMKHAMSARIMPYYEGDNPAGIKLVWVRKRSIYDKIGLKSGDVVQEINGKTLNVKNALSLYSELPYADKIKVNIIRNGVRKTIVYQIK